MLLPPQAWDCDFTNHFLIVSMLFSQVSLWVQLNFSFERPLCSLFDHEEVYLQYPVSPISKWEHQSQISLYNGGREQEISDPGLPSPTPPTLFCSLGPLSFKFKTTLSCLARLVVSSCLFEILVILAYVFFFYPVNTCLILLIYVTL